MSSGVRAQAAARVLVALRTTRAPSPPAALPTELAPRSQAEAYAVQGALRRLLGARVGGWKASMSGADGGLAAPLYAADIHDSPAHLDSAGMQGVGIEPEMAFTLARDLPPLPDGRRYELAQLEDAIAAVHAVIEIVASRFASLEAAPPLDRLADNLSNAGLVRGAACRDWRDLALADLPLRLELRRPDGSRSVHQGRGAHPCSDPRLPLLWLINDANTRGAPLRGGDLVTTGSCAGLHPIERGTRVSVSFEGLGSAELDWH